MVLGHETSMTEDWYLLQPGGQPIGVHRVRKSIHIVILFHSPEDVHDGNIFDASQHNITNNVCM